MWRSTEIGLALIVVIYSLYALTQELLYRYVTRSLAETQHEHARWIGICLELTKNGCDTEAKIAADQVVILRREINFYRRLLVWLRRTQGASK
jgi:hypothetical protein